MSVAERSLHVRKGQQCAIPARVHVPPGALYSLERIGKLSKGTTLSYSTSIRPQITTTNSSLLSLSQGRNGPLVDKDSIGDHPLSEDFLLINAARAGFQFNPKHRLTILRRADTELITLVSKPPVDVH